MLVLSPGVERELLLRDFGVLEGGQAVVLQLVSGTLLHHLCQVLVHVHLVKQQKTVPFCSFTIMALICSC